MQQQSTTPQRLGVNTAPNWKANRSTIQQVGLNCLEPDPENPRTVGSRDAMTSLIKSIQEKGVKVPLIIRPHDEDPDKAYIVAGHRRHRAAHEAGLSTVPCILTDGGISEVEILENLLMDNIHREAVPPIDAARVFRKMMQVDNLSQSQVAARLSITQTEVSRGLALLDKIPARAHKAINSGVIPVQTAYLISQLPEDNRYDVCKAVVAGEIDASGIKNILGNNGRQRTRLNSRPSGGVGATTGRLKTNDRIQASNGITIGIMFHREARAQTKITALLEAIELLREEEREKQQ